MFETVSILLAEAARVVQRSAESLAIRLFSQTPALIARIFTLGGAAERLGLGRAVEAVGEIESAAQEAVEGAVEEVAATAGPLVLLRSAKALAGRRRSVPVAALVAGAVGITALALRRAVRPRHR